MSDRSPSAGDSEANFAGNQLPSCDEADCTDDAEYLSKEGVFCDFHAWTNGVQRWTAGGVVTTDNDQEGNHDV